MAEINEQANGFFRRNLGVLGVSLPVILAVGSGFNLQPSISDFYYTNLGIVFTGVMISFGLFLYSYKGHERENELFSDDRITHVAGILAILTALVPTTCANNCAMLPPNAHNSELVGSIHLSCASGFYVIIGWMSFARFSRSRNPHRRRRNRIYRVCGIGVWVCLFMAGLSVYLKTSFFGSIDVFMFESLGLWFFGVAWLVKGDMFKRYGL